MTWWNKIMAGITAFRTALNDPEAESSSVSQSQRLDRYRQAWAYYNNTMFSTRDGANWSGYLAQRELYKHTRLVFNPVPNVVDFYTDNLWKPAKDETLPTLATPVLVDTDNRIIKAVAQIDQWSNWLSEKNKLIKYVASTGNCLVEGIDDLESQKIYHKTIWAGFVKDVQLDSRGNVETYSIEYDVFDNQTKRTFTYKKVVTPESFTYFRDDKPFIPQGKSASEEVNPYGFCFAVWLKHGDNGGDYGQPAITAFDKVDEINALASHLHDNIHKEIESGKIIGVESTTDWNVLSGASKNKDGSLNTVDPRLGRLLVMAKGNVTVADLSGLLKLAEAHPYLKELLLSFGSDYPELEYKQILKDSAQISGIALERLLTPAQNRLDGVQAYYNQQLVKLRQMQLAVGGMRINGGGWDNRTTQQQLFSPFNLQSYNRGDLDFQIKPSVLITMSEKENEELLQAKATRAKTLDGIVDNVEKLKIAGYEEKDANEIIARKEAEQPNVDPNLLNGGNPLLLN